jgi:hypothetical protein
MPADSTNNSLSDMADALIKAFEVKPVVNSDKKVSVNILVSKVAAWYEKFRTAMDYGNEETILRRAIERILKRMLFLDKDSKSLAEDLVRELVWAGYFEDATVPESTVAEVANSIKLYLKLKETLLTKKAVPNENVTECIIQLLSCEIHFVLKPNKEKEAMTNFMFRIFRNTVDILDDSKQTRDVQVFIAVRKNFARDDIAFLRYKLFSQIFGKLTETNFDQVVENFGKAYQEVKYQLNYPRKDRIFNHVKKKTPAFLVLYDILMQERWQMRILIKNSEEFRGRVFADCEKRYKNIRGKITTAIIRSFVFILVTKAVIALALEGTFENLFYGQIQWASMGINIVVPPLLMVFAGLLIKTPNSKNSQKIFTDMQKLLLEENPQLISPLSLKLKSDTTRSLKDFIFSTLWILITLLVFGLIVTLLAKLHFNLLSQGIFLFFIAIISFLTYRIYQTANIYTVVSRQGVIGTILDFFFVPVIRVGRKLTEGIAQINFILIIVDFIIEAPFKGLVGFFEQWFLFVANKREELE